MWDKCIIDGEEKNKKALRFFLISRTYHISIERKNEISGKEEKGGRGIFILAALVQANAIKKFTLALDLAYMYMRKVHYLTSLVYLFGKSMCV